MIMPDPDQQNAIETVLYGHRNVFLTGRPGTGKSAVVQWVKGLCPRKIVFLAPTGLAALNIEGSTIHSFFKFPTTILPDGFVPNISPDQCDLMNEVEVIVIDEISMVRSDIFNAIDTTLRAAAPEAMKCVPFAGKQIVAVGDFSQLSPVFRAQYGEWTQLNEYHGGVFAFEAKAWSDACFHNCILRQVHRQSGETEFLSMLDAFRRGHADTDNEDALHAAIEVFNQTVDIRDAPPSDAIALCATRAQAQIINQCNDDRIPGYPFIFTARESGAYMFVDDDDLPTDRTLRLKIGSRVMAIKNVPSLLGGFEYVNGDIGTVVNIYPDEPSVEVLLDCGRCVIARPQTWLKVEYVVERNEITGASGLVEKYTGSFVQLPLKHASAITIHKSQGQTIDRAHIQLGPNNAFASGQLYTALSRVRSLRSLSIDRPLRIPDAKLHPAVTEFYKRIEGADMEDAGNWDGQRLAGDVGMSVPL